MPPYLGTVDNSRWCTEESGSTSSHRNSPSQHRSNLQAGQRGDLCSRTPGYLHPDTELGVVDDIVSHRKLDLVLWWVDRLNLVDEASLGTQHLSVRLGHVWEHGHYQRVGAVHLPQSLGQTHHSLHVVPISSQERNVCPLLPLAPDISMCCRGSCCLQHIRWRSRRHAM